MSESRAKVVYGRFLNGNDVAADLLRAAMIRLGRIRG